MTGSWTSIRGKFVADETTEGRALRAEARLADAALLGRQMVDLQHRVEEYGRGIEGVEGRLPAARFVREIEPGLGFVEVDGRAELVDIRLDPKTVKLSRPDLLGGRVLEAIRRAEGDAREAHAVEMRRLGSGFR